MGFLIKFISIFIALYVIYQLASMASLFSEKSGIVNISIEGNMVLSASIFSILMTKLIGITGSKELEIFIAIIITLPLSALYSICLSHLSNKYLSDNVIVGTGLNLLAPAVGLLGWHWLVDSHSDNILTTSYDQWILLININNSSYTFQILFVWFLIPTIFLVLISAFILNKTSFGLRLKSSGENPYSLETSGVSVLKTRNIALYIAGLFSSLAGILFAIKGTFSFTVNGSGFLGVGILILGQYKITGIIIGSLVFSILIALFTSLPFALDLKGFDYLLNTIPFIIPIIGLMIFSKHSSPASLGKNFKKDQR